MRPRYRGEFPIPRKAEEDMPGVSERGYETGDDLVRRLRGEESSKNEVKKPENNIIEDKENQNEEFVMETVAIPANKAPPVNTISKKPLLARFTAAFFTNSFHQR